MQRRDFLTAATAAGFAAVAPASVLPTAKADDDASARRYILLETYFTQSAEKRDALVAKFDAILIPERNKLGFDKVGVFTPNADLNKGERGLEPFANAVFVVSEAATLDALTTLQDRSVADGSNAFNATDDLDFVDQEISALLAFPTQPQITVPFNNEERVLQLRVYNSPNFERNFAKEKMFDVRGELDLFRRCGMAPVFFGRTLFGSMAPNISYMLSFPNDKARREGWDKFVKSAEWKEMSGEAEFARTATRIRNIFLKPSPKSQI